MEQHERSLLSLVESAETKLRRQQQARAGWKLKSPAFVTLHDEADEPQKQAEAHNCPGRPAENLTNRPSEKHEKQGQGKHNLEHANQGEGHDDEHADEKNGERPRPQQPMNKPTAIQFGDCTPAALSRDSSRPRRPSGDLRRLEAAVAATTLRDQDKIDGLECKQRLAKAAEAEADREEAEQDESNGGASASAAAAGAAAWNLDTKLNHQQPQQQTSKQKKLEDLEERTRSIEQVDDRGGPTPTNDLIRTLHQRDKRAFQISGAGAGGGGGDMHLASNHHHHHHQLAQQRPHHDFQLQRVQPDDDEKNEQDDDDDDDADDQCQDLPFPSPPSACLFRRRSSQANNEDLLLSPRDERQHQQHQQHQQQQQQQQHQRQQQRKLSDNNDTCRRSTIASFDLNAPSVGATGSAPRTTTTTTTALITDGRFRATQAGELGQQRSTYMLPLLLLNKRRDTSESDDDDDEDDDENEHEQEDESNSDDDDDDESSDFDKSLPLTAFANAGRKVVAPGARGGGKTSRSVVTAGHNLRTSASSPSNLSTPTNDLGSDGRGGGGGDCGGPCCRGQVTGPAARIQLWQQQRQQQPPQSQQRRQSVAGVSGGSKHMQTMVMFERNGAKQQREQQQQQQVILRHRAGSNPLDRVRRKSTQQTGPTTSTEGLAHGGGSAALRLRQLQPQQQQQQQQTSTSTTFNKHLEQQQQQQQIKCQSFTGKRHSIINLLSNSSLHTSNLLGMGLHRNSSSGDFAGRRAATARRLTSGGELTTAAAKVGNQQQHQQDGRFLRECRESSNWQYNNNNTHTHDQQQQQQQQQQQPQYDPLIPESGFKIVVLGTSGSGKTSIIQRFLYGTFTARHLPTVEDTYFIEFPYKKNLINISVSDTSGTYSFPAMRKLAINSGDAFILVYSVDDPESFDYLEQLRQNILDEREQAYLESVLVTGGSCPSNSSSASSSSLALAATNNDGNCTTSAVCGGGGNLQSAAASSQVMGSLTSTVMNNGKHHHHQPRQQQQQHNSNQLQTSSGFSSSINNHHLSSGGGNCNSAGHNNDLSPSRHWSLASLFGGHHNHGANSQQRQVGGAGANGANFGCQVGLSAANHHQQQQHHHSSIGSSICSSSNSCSSSADNSRRSSISAAEAALRTRRTRRPPIVIVANKHDLPRDKHLVNSDEIEALAVIDWNNGFVRASAALNWNIDEIFQQVLMQARQPPTLSEAIVSKRRKSLPPKLPHP